MIVLAVCLGYPIAALLATRVAYGKIRAMYMRDYGITAHAFDSGAYRTSYSLRFRTKARIWSVVVGLFWPVCLGAYLAVELGQYPLRTLAWLAFANPRPSQAERNAVRRAALDAREARIAALEREAGIAN